MTPAIAAGPGRSPRMTTHRTTSARALRTATLSLGLIAVLAGTGCARQRVRAGFEDVRDELREMERRLDEVEQRLARLEAR